MIGRVLSVIHALRAAFRNRRRAQLDQKLLAKSLSVTQPSIGSTATKLHLGCGMKIKEGWLNTDIMFNAYEVPDIRNVVSHIFLLDATQEFPFRDQQFEYIYCEDFIEHFEQKDGLSIMVECFRVLKPGGVWRLSTPSFDKIIGRLDLSSRRTVEWAHWGWGHRLLYTEAYMRDLLEKCGFGDVVLCGFGESRHAALRNQDTRADQQHINLIVEATRR